MVESPNPLHVTDSVVPTQLLPHKFAYYRKLLFVVGGGMLLIFALTAYNVVRFGDYDRPTGFGSIVATLTTAFSLVLASKKRLTAAWALFAVSIVGFVALAILENGILEL